MCGEMTRALILVGALVGLAQAAPSGDLQVEHREASIPLSEGLDVEHRVASGVPEVLPDITSNLPAVSPDLFIWTGSDGTYRFGMQSEDQWRVETRDSAGVVTGRYVYKTPDGQTVDISYDAGPQGYRARGDAIPGGVAPTYEGNEEEESVAYGALRVAGQEATMPEGNGVITYTDDDAYAIVTDIQEPEDRPLVKLVAYPIVSNVVGSPGLVVGPPIVPDGTVKPAAIPV